MAAQRPGRGCGAAHYLPGCARRPTTSGGACGPLPRGVRGGPLPQKSDWRSTTRRGVPGGPLPPVVTFLAPLAALGSRFGKTTGRGPPVGGLRCCAKRRWRGAAGQALRRGEGPEKSVPPESPARHQQQPSTAGHRTGEALRCDLRAPASGSEKSRPEKGTPTTGRKAPPTTPMEDPPTTDQRWQSGHQKVERCPRRAERISLPQTTQGWPSRP